MKPETHLLAGLVIGASFTPGRPFWECVVISAAAAVGSVLPDIPIALQVKADDMAGRKRFSTEKEGSFWFVLKDISHSPLLWLPGILLLFRHQDSLAGLIGFLFSLGVMSHWIMDMFTHCGEEFRDTDQSLLWPLYYLVPGASRPGHIPKLGYLVGKHVGGWEYRYNYKVQEEYENLSLTKPPERLTQLIFVGTWIVLVLIWIVNQR